MIDIAADQLAGWTRFHRVVALAALLLITDFRHAAGSPDEASAQEAGLPGRALAMTVRISVAVF